MRTTVIKLRGETPLPPAFAALREGARIYQACLSQTLLVWPMICAKSLMLGSGLEAPLRRQKFSDLLDECLADLEAELGPLYSEIFAQAHGKNPLRFDSTRAAQPVEIYRLLDKIRPRWRYEFTLDPAVVHVTPLYQIHRLKDSEGRRWLLKVIKPSSRSKLNSALNALREIETVLRPLKDRPAVAKIWVKVENFRLKAQREADLALERRTLQRAARHGEGVEVHPNFNHRDLVVTADPTFMHADEVKKSSARKWPVVWKSAATQKVSMDKGSRRNVSVAATFEGFPIKPNLIRPMSANPSFSRSTRRI